MLESLLTPNSHALMIYVVSPRRELSSGDQRRGYNAAMDYAEHGFLRVVAVAPPVEVGHPAANAETILGA